MFPRSSLRRSIYVTCAILVGLCVVAFVVGWLGQVGLLEAMRSQTSAAELIERTTRIDRGVVELKARTENYLQTGSSIQLDAAKEIADNLEDQIDSLAPSTTLSASGDLADTLEQMRESLTVFRQRMGQAAIERSLRTELVQVELPTADEQLRRRLEILQSSLYSSLVDPSEAETKVRPRSAFHIESLARNYSQSRQSLLRYFIEPDAKHFEEFLRSLKLARDHLGELQASESRTSRTTEDTAKPWAETLNQLESDLVRFEDIGTRAFQATRGYRYYADVVMAGAINEFTYYSDRLKTYSDALAQASRREQQATVRRTRYFALGASLVSIFFAAWLATRLSRAIVAPITRLTHTFQRLSRGETIDEVPEIRRDDEIGRMSRAAQVFSDKNLETQTLLHRAERLTSELEKRAQDLQRINHDLDHFAYVASHDLRSPLRGIQHLVQWIAEDAGDVMPEDAKTHLSQIEERVQKMDLLLSDLLAYSRAGRKEVEPQTFDMEGLFDDIQAMVDLPEGMRLHFPMQPPRVHTVRTPLSQVLLNLVTNAVKYNDKGAAGVIEVDVRSVDDNLLRFTVRDNGRGIDPRYHEKIFEMYQRVATDVKDGSGMGLAIAKKQVEASGGRMTLRSVPGEGSTFDFTWGGTLAEGVTETTAAS